MRNVVIGILLVSVQALTIAVLLWYRSKNKTLETKLLANAGKEYAGVSREISLTEAVLRESQDRFRLAMNNVASGLYTLDPQGMVTYVNPAAEAMFGFSSAELLGKKMHDVTHLQASRWHAVSSQRLSGPAGSAGKRRAPGT